MVLPQAWTQTGEVGGETENHSFTRGGDTENYSFTHLPEERGSDRPVYVNPHPHLSAQPFSEPLTRYSQVYILEILKYIDIDIYIYNICNCVYTHLYMYNTKEYSVFGTKFFSDH